MNQPSGNDIQTGSFYLFSICTTRNNYIVFNSPISQATKTLERFQC